MVGTRGTRLASGGTGAREKIEAGPWPSELEKPGNGPAPDRRLFLPERHQLRTRNLHARNHGGEVRPVENVGELPGGRVLPAGADCHPGKRLALGSNEGTAVARCGAADAYEFGHLAGSSCGP